MLSKEKSKSYDDAMSSALTIANFLTVLRLILIPVFVTALYYQRFSWALAVFLVAAVTDRLDGLVARSFNQKTQLGEILDPMADKLLLVTAFVILSLPRFTPTDPIPFWLTVVISRDAIIVLSAAVINMTTGFSRFRLDTWQIEYVVQIVMIVFSSWPTPSACWRSTCRWPITPRSRWPYSPGFTISLTSTG